jgi:NAD(P)-dependent dehydrogenase (short-subunit alcohol dehydrogenase family)
MTQSSDQIIKMNIGTKMYTKCDRVVALVTGGSRGIGRAAAARLAAQGHSIAVLSRSLEGSRSAAGALALVEEGQQHIGVECDVKDEKAISAAIGETVSTLGNIGTLVNAAGIVHNGLLLRTSKDELVSVLEANLIGSIMVTKLALRSMLKIKNGPICILSFCIAIYAYVAFLLAVCRLHS